MRTYSSGMFGRLAFSVAAHLKPEILLIDEALSAGDAAFKHEVDAEDRGAVRQPALHGVDRVARSRGREGSSPSGCVWLDRGIVRLEGPADEVVAAYMSDENIEATSATALEDV